MTPFDTQSCVLGEGPLWHPERQALFWFDIIGKQMHMRGKDASETWAFSEHFSAAGWIDRDTLLLASESALWHFDIASGEKARLCDLEADNMVTRSNDGRADPWGGFWIGTMGKAAEPNAGTIYRYYNGTLRPVAQVITVSNAISFPPDRSCAYFTDTVTHRVMRQPLRAEDGWPDGAATVFLDLTDARLYPDGAVTDAAGNLWIAMWGAGCVVAFAPDGREIRRIDVPARQPSCPAFGGPELRDLYITSATQGLRPEEIEKRPLNGATFVAPDVAQGLAEPRVIL